MEHTPVAINASSVSSKHKSSASRNALGPLLCWAVVFADIGTSVYYVPGYLYGNHDIGTLAGFFVFLTMSIFVLLAFKYAEVTHRFPQGGGVVTVAAQALNRWFGALGGMFILVDYFLTAAISCLSGMLYLSVVVPALDSNIVQVWFVSVHLSLLAITIGVLVILGILNWMGIRESAKVSLVGAVIAFLGDIAILITVFTHLSLSEFFSLFPKMFEHNSLTPMVLLFGFAASFLAFSGLESISQLAPVMKTPRKRTTGLALLLVVVTIGITSPLLTMFSTLLLPGDAANPIHQNQLISLLAGHWGNSFLQAEIAISASALLVFASNTAIIGAYHVFLALTQMDFLPAIVLKRNKIRATPHYAIALATGIPIIILVLVGGQIDYLFNLYAFGLLGAFTLTCLGIDILRYRERKVVPHHLWRMVVFWVGVATTILVATAWSTNLITKSLATEFGGTVAVIGMLIAYLNNRNQQKKYLVVVPTRVVGRLPESVLAVLTARNEHNEDVINTAIATTHKQGVVFLYISEAQSSSSPQLFEIYDPYLSDQHAKEAFVKAESLARQAHIIHQFVYNQDTDAVRQVWQVLHPHDTVVARENIAYCEEINPDFIRYQVAPSNPVVHLLKIG
jgi:amino acid transporter